MALGINFGSGGVDIIPIIKLDSRAGRVYKRDRVDGETIQYDITKTFKAVFDFEKNLSVGWINFDVVGAPPDFCVVPFGESYPQQPSDKHKQGVRIIVKLSKELDGSIREFATTAKSALRGIDELHNDYLEGVKANPGKLPVVVIKDFIPIETGSGARRNTSYSPVFEITAWVARPADLVAMPKDPPKAAAPRAPSTGSTAPTPPAQPVSAEDDFG